MLSLTTPMGASMTELVQIPDDSFVVAQAESDGLPDIWIINKALAALTPKAAFPWHLSIVVECAATHENGLPTALPAFEFQMENDPTWDLAAPHLSITPRQE